MSEQTPNPGKKIGSDLVKQDSSFAEIVVQFVDGLGERLTKMTDALNTTDFDALRMAAHQLKGSGGGYGYPALTERASKLEQFAKDQALEDCTASLGELKALCSRVVVDDRQD